MALSAASGKLTSAAISEATQRRTLASRDFMPIKASADAQCAGADGDRGHDGQHDKTRPLRLDIHVLEVALAAFARRRPIPRAGAGAASGSAPDALFFLALRLG